MYMMFLAMLAVSSLSFAEGGQIKKPVPIEEGECAFVIPGNTELCQWVPAPGHSGVNVYICEVLVACPPDNGEEDDDGKNHKYLIK